MEVISNNSVDENEMAWEKVFSSQEWGKYPSEDLIRFIARNFYGARDRRAIKILEIGCGPGANIWYLARENFTVYGIDFSKIAIKKAKDRLDAEIEDWKGGLIVGDICKLPYENEYFDAIIDIEAVAHNSFDKAKRIYTEAGRVLKTGGYLYLRTFATGSWGDGIGENKGHNLWVASEGPLKEKGTVRFTAQEEISYLLSNLNVIDIELLNRKVNSLKNEIKEWCVTCKKL